MISKVDEEDTEDVAIFETMPEPGVPVAQPHHHWEAVEAFYQSAIQEYSAQERRYLAILSKHPASQPYRRGEQP